MTRRGTIGKPHPHQLIMLNDTMLKGARTGALNILQDALRKGAQVNFRQGANYTNALQLATQHKQHEACRMLLDWGADVNICTKRGYTPLHFAAHNLLETMNLLLDHGADVNAYTLSGTSELYGSTPLFEAIHFRAWEHVRDLLRAGADPLLPVQNCNGKSVLHGMPVPDAATKDMLAHYAALPRVELSPRLSKADLLEKNAAGQCPLDNPVTWRQWQEISGILAKKGESLSRDELLQPAAAGGTYLSIGCDARQLEHIVTTLNAAGKGVGMHELCANLPADAPMRQSDYAIRALFTSENMRIIGRDGFYRSIDAIPVEARDKVANYRRLSLELQQLEWVEQKGAGR